MTLEACQAKCWPRFPGVSCGAGCRASALARERRATIGCQEPSGSDALQNLLMQNLDISVRFEESFLWFLLFEITSALSVPEPPRRQSNRIYLQRGMTCLMCLVSHQRVKLFSEPPEDRKLIHHWRYQMSTLGLPSFNKIWCQKVHKILKNRESFEFYKHVHREVPRRSKYGLK